MNTLVAYSGIYTAEGDKWATNVDVAWNPEWVGTKQVRDFRVDGERLMVLTPWRVMPNWADKVRLGGVEEDRALSAAVMLRRVQRMVFAGTLPA